MTWENSTLKIFENEIDLPSDLMINLWLEEDWLIPDLVWESLSHLTFFDKEKT
jgi:hypothetical protein